MIVSMVSRDPGDLPRWVIDTIAAHGINLECRACRNPAELLEFAPKSQVLWFTGPNLCITPEALRSLPSCRAVFRSGSGLDSIPLDVAAELGIEVHNTPESIAESVAEHTAALLMSLVRQIPQQDRRVRVGEWVDSEPLQRWHLSRRTLGMVGYGNIARLTAKMLQGFDLEVLYYDPVDPSSTPLAEVISQSDIVSLHCPLTENTRGMIGHKELASMKPGALLVNTARGPIIDEEALVDALVSGHLGGAALDVLCEEPPPPDHPLLSLDNVILTPHIAAFSADFERNFWQASVDKIKYLVDRFG